MIFRDFFYFVCLISILAVLNPAAPAAAPDTTPANTIDFGIYRDCPVIQNASTRVVFCPQVGGRILEYSLDGINSLFVSKYELTGEVDETDVIGKSPSAGRFDIGPERIAPRRTESFFGAWKVEAHQPHLLRMTSQRGSLTGVQLTRTFRLDPKSSRLTCEQTILNVSDETKQYCHWSRTFGRQAGIVLIPLKGFPRFRNRYVRFDRGGLHLAPTDDNVRIRDGFLEILGPPKSPKLGMDSYAGWLAHQQPSGLLFIKQFPTYPDRHYCEGAAITISTWTPASGTTVELEPIGPAETLQPRESASFTETWTLHKSNFPPVGEPLDLDRLKQIHASLPDTELEGPQSD